MPSTYELIASATVGSGGIASVTFSSIPSTYTDLVLKTSARSTFFYIGVKLNGSTTGYSKRSITGSGTTVTSSAESSTASYTQTLLSQNDAALANTFNNAEIYFPNYSSANDKSYSIDTVQEDNATGAYMQLAAVLWANSAAITSIELTADGPLILQHSTFYLYGIKSS
jgi:Tfp pilus assembly protein PilE